MRTNHHPILNLTKKYGHHGLFYGYPIDLVEHRSASSRPNLEQWG